MSFSSICASLKSISNTLKKLYPFIITELITVQPWVFAAAFGNAVVNAVLYWFYDGKKNAVVKDFMSVVFIFTFYSTVDCRCKLFCLLLFTCNVLFSNIEHLHAVS